MSERLPDVLHVTTCFPRFKNDFAGSFVFRFAKYLKLQGSRVGAIAPGAPGIVRREVMDGIEIYRFDYFFPPSRQCLCYDGGGILANLRRSWVARLQLPFLMIGLVREIAKHRKDYEIIHCHWLPTTWAAWLAQAFSRDRRPIVFTNWGSDTRLLPGWLIRLSLRAVTACASTAAETDQHLIANGCSDFQRISAPLDEDRFNTSVDRHRFLVEQGLDYRVPIISFVGRLNYFKDPLTFIAASAVLRERGVGFHAVLAGDGDLMERCRNRVSELGLDDSVRLLGTRSDVEYIFAASTLTVHISPIENTWANSIAEAMQTGCPVLLTDVGYTRTTFTHGMDCWLVKAEDAESIAAGMETLLADADLRRRLSDGGLQLLKAAGKDSGTVVANLIAFYKDALRK
jgi:glycosyltransferase involved in cell wall biosynthesis